MVYIERIYQLKTEKRFYQYWNGLVKKLKLQMHPLIVKHVSNNLLKNYIKKKSDINTDCWSMIEFYTNK